MAEDILNNASEDNDSLRSVLTPTQKHSKYVLSSFIVMTLSYATFNLFYFLTRIVMAQNLSVPDYGLVTYSWAMGSTIGFLFMVGREQDASVRIPRMNWYEQNTEASYIRRVFGSLNVVALGVFLGISMVIGLETQIWAIIGIALSQFLYSMEAYTLIASKKFKSHFMMSITFYGGTFLAVFVLGELNYLIAEIVLMSFIGLFFVTNFLGAFLIKPKLKEDSVTVPSSNAAELMHTWSMTRFDRTNLRYFAVDIVATFVPLSPILFLQFFHGFELVA
ncbi:MAG: hypothetical protein ACTSWA_13470, partial [Candidatus Thorarchaeota archaeon]